YAQRLVKHATHEPPSGSELKDMPIPFAVANEVTCLAILRELRTMAKTEGDESGPEKGLFGELVFPLATATSVSDSKTPLPEFMLGVMVGRDNQAAFEYLQEALWHLLQTDVEFFSQAYCRLFRNLIRFASECNGPKHATAWAEYTLRLSSSALDKYVDQ